MNFILFNLRSLTLNLALVMLLLSSNSAAQNLEIYDLQCEYLQDPIGLDVPNPRFKWKLSNSSLSVFQKSWQLIVGIDSVAVANNRGSMWNTGIMDSIQQLVTYAGKPLQPFTKYYWKVIVVDNRARKVNSRIASYEMGILNAENWSGFWIDDGKSPSAKQAPVFRKRFNADRKIKKARVYLAVAGLYELTLNGTKIGNSVLDPAYTRFDRRILYVTHDIKSQIKPGANIVGIMLGNGWYNHQSTAVWNFHQAPWRNRPTFCMDIRITYEDGTEQLVYSDRDWKTTTGPVVFNSIYTAEHYDARKEITGWDLPAFEDSSWGTARYRSAPAPLIRAQALHPIRRKEKLNAIRLNKISDTVYVYHFEKNMAGVTQIEARGDSGTMLRIKHGERLLPGGRVDLSNLDVHYRPTDDSDPFQTDIFILSGKGMERFSSPFGYKGFQYVEVTSSKPVYLTEASLVAIPMHSDVPVAGSIETSHPLIKSIWQATNNSYLSNLFGYPTDCPQREKNGWTGDAHIAQETGLYNFDGITIYEKWLADHRDEQQPNGVLPSIIPTGGWGYDWGNGPDWTSTIAIIPWNLYLFYGDDKALRESYHSIKRYVDHITELYPSGLTQWGLGDWIPVRSQTAVEFTSTAYYFKDVSILAKAAKLFGKKDDFAKYSTLAAQIKSAFNSKYFDRDHQSYGSGLQTELSVALHFDLVEESFRKDVAKKLAERVVKDTLKLDVGLLGSKSILNALGENGYPELAFQLATRDSFPSWGWWIKNGATTLYENWPIDAKSDISMNHIMFGEISAWFFKALGGIQPDPQQPGFRHFFLRPYFPEKLEQFSATYNSPFGIIRSSWERKGDTIAYSLAVPDNSVASLELELPKGTIIWEGAGRGKPAGVQFGKKLSHGRYDFRIVLPGK